MKTNKEVAENFITSSGYDFVANKHGVFIYSAGPHSFELTAMFEDLLDHADQFRRKKEDCVLNYTGGNDL